jgi:hypothetical protein
MCDAAKSDCSMSRAVIVQVSCSTKRRRAANVA